MKAASVVDIRKALKTLPPEELNAICLRLAKYKTENKELLTYLLFEKDEQSYIEMIKEEIADQFEEINSSNLYWAKKSIRKILRNINKQIRYSGQKTTEVELLIFFCDSLNSSGIPFRRSMALKNLFDRQIEKCQKSIGKLHEDLQADYLYEMRSLNLIL